MPHVHTNIINDLTSFSESPLELRVIHHSNHFSHPLQLSNIYYLQELINSRAPFFLALSHFGTHYLTVLSPPPHSLPLSLVYCYNTYSLFTLYYSGSMHMFTLAIYLAIHVTAVFYCRNCYRQKTIANLIISFYAIGSFFVAIIIVVMIALYLYSKRWDS